MNRIKLIAAALLTVAPGAYAAETHTEAEYHEVRNVAGQRQGDRHPTREACIAAAEAMGVAEGKTRTVGEAWYNCYSVKSFKFTFKPGTTPAPEPVTLAVPQNFTALPTSTTTVTLNWQAVEGAKRYLIERCNGSNCTNFSQLSCYPNGTTRQHGSLTPGQTYRYRIRASKNDYCSATPSGNLSGWSSVISATTPTTTPNPPNPDPEPDPTPTPSGSAILSWTPPTHFTNGDRLTTLRNYRILYGTSATNLDRSVETTADPTLRTYTVRNLAPGTYYFAIRAIAGGGAESANSNVVTKVVR